MIVVQHFRRAFWVEIKDEPLVRHGWFDIAERKYIPNEEMERIYNQTVLDPAELAKDLYIPIPVLKERTVIHDFLREYSLEFLLERYNNFRAQEDLYALRNYEDENGTWLHDAYSAYERFREFTFMNQWINENHIENAVVHMPSMLPSDPSTSYNGDSWMQRSRKLCQIDEEFYMKNRSIRRDEKNRLVHVNPSYLRLKYDRFLK